MPATTHCARCRKEFDIADDRNGASPTCPACGAALPRPADMAAASEPVPTQPHLRVVATDEDWEQGPPPPRSLSAAISPAPAPRSWDSLGLTGFLVRLAALGAVCLAALAGMLLWKGSSLVMIALYAVGLLVVVSVANLLVHRSQEPTLRVVGAVILVAFAAIGLLSLLAAAFLFLVSCLVNL